MVYTDEGIVWYPDACSNSLGLEHRIHSSY